MGDEALGTAGALPPSRPFLCRGGGISCEVQSSRQRFVLGTVEAVSLQGNKMCVSRRRQGNDFHP